MFAYIIFSFILEYLAIINNILFVTILTWVEILCGGGDVPVDTEWLFESFPRIFSSRGVALVSVVEVLAIEEDVNAEDDASNDVFSSTGDVAFVDVSFACETTVISVLEFSTRESLSGTIASENHKFSS